MINKVPSITNYFAFSGNLGSQPHAILDCHTQPIRWRAQCQVVSPHAPCFSHGHVSFYRHHLKRVKGDAFSDSTLPIEYRLNRTVCWQQWLPPRSGEPPTRQYDHVRQHLQTSLRNSESCLMCMQNMLLLMLTQLVKLRARCDL